MSLDNGIIAYYDQIKANPTVVPDPNDIINLPPYMIAYDSDYPKTYPRFMEGTDLLYGFGAFYFFVPYMVSKYL